MFFYEKKNLLLPLMLLIAAAGVVDFYSFKPLVTATVSKPTVNTEKNDQGSCLTTFDCALFDGCYLGGPYLTPPICATLPPSNCTSNWKVVNFGHTRSGSTVTFHQLAVCYKPATAPPWSSFSKIAYLRDPLITPASTKVFSATASNGATFQCTVYSNGDWYIQKTAGTDPPGPGTMLSGSYTL